MGVRSPSDQCCPLNLITRVTRVAKIIVLASFSGFFILIGVIKLSLLYGETSISLIIPQFNENSKDPIDTWRYIGNKENRHKIFSAYFDSRPEILDYYSPDYEGYQPYGSVRIFGVLSTNWRLRVYCNFLYEDGNVRQVPTLEYRPINEHRYKKLSAYTIMCPLTNHRSVNPVKLPKYVAICYEDDPKTLSEPTYVPIRYHKESAIQEPNRALAVCVGPVHDRYGEARRLVEFVHIYQLMGAEKFYFYNASVSAAVNSVLDYFGTQGSVENIQWNFHDYQFERDIRQDALFVAVNDCVYRATFVDGFKYVAVVDSDEILISFKYKNLVEYLNNIDTKNSGSFAFRGVFFHKSDESGKSITPPGIKNKFLYTQSRTRRTSEPFPEGDRSKYIVKARAAIEMGTHFVTRAIGTYEPMTLSTNEALLFHYRDNCVVSSCYSERMTDLTLRRYASLLWHMVEKTCHTIFPDDLCPIYIKTKITKNGIIFV